MSDALGRLLNGVIDYAGLFPPAKLSMADSVANYLRYQSGPEGWIVDRFVCGSASLGDLQAELEKHTVSEPIPLTVIGKAASREDWGDALVHDAEAMTGFIGRVGDKVDIEAYEMRLPDHENLEEYLRDLRSFNQVDVFCELPWSPLMRDSLGLVAEQDWIEAKARTGGQEVSAFPPSEDLAAFLQQCVQLDLGYKLTAGLHHPFRGLWEDAPAKMHGFLNVAVASVMLHAHDLSVKETAIILDSEDPSDFSFKGNAIRFKDWVAGVEDIDDARTLFVGFGSCSVVEPLQDLKSHQLI